jgi:hypothetical protein
VVTRSDGYEGLSAFEKPPASLTVRAQGYLNDPVATRESVTSDGWYKTGDALTRDVDGFYHVVDRIKEMIKYKVRKPPNQPSVRRFEFSDFDPFEFRAPKVL